MKRLFLALVIFFVFIHVQGQWTNKLSNLPKLLKTPTFMLRIPQSGSRLNARVWVFPSNTPKSQILQYTQNERCEYRVIEMPESIKHGTPLHIGLNFLHPRDGLGFKNNKQVLSYDERGVKSVKFEFEDIQSLSEIEDYMFTISENGETHSIFEDEVEVISNITISDETMSHDTDVESKVKWTKNLFENFDTLLFWKEAFLDFLQAHGNFFKDNDGHYSINTSADPTSNKVTQAFACFLRIWCDNNNLPGFSGPACWRFLTEEYQKEEHPIKRSVEENSWRTWFIKWYEINYKDKKTDELERNPIYRKVKEYYIQISSAE